MPSQNMKKQVSSRIPCTKHSHTHTPENTNKFVLYLIMHSLIRWKLCCQPPIPCFSSAPRFCNLSVNVCFVKWRMLYPKEDSFLLHFLSVKSVFLLRYVGERMKAKMKRLADKLLYVCLRIRQMPLNNKAEHSIQFGSWYLDFVAGKMSVKEYYALHPPINTKTSKWFKLNRTCSLSSISQICWFSSILISHWLKDYNWNYRPPVPAVQHNH